MQETLSRSVAQQESPAPETGILMHRSVQMMRRDVTLLLSAMGCHHQRSAYRDESWGEQFRGEMSGARSFEVTIDGDFLSDKVDFEAMYLGDGRSEYLSHQQVLASSVLSILNRFFMPQQ